MNRIQQHIPSLLGIHRTTASRIQIQPLRFYAKKASPFKYSHPESKSTSATLSPSSLASSSASVGAREVAATTSRRTGGSANFSRQLADMCAKQDIVMYTPPETLKKTFWLAYATAGLQLVFWGNVAQYAFTHYTDNPMFSLPSSTTTETPGTLPGTEGVAPVDTPLAPLRTRIIISAGLVGTGLVIAFGICAIPWRYVTKLTFLRGGTQIRIETGRKFPPGYHRMYQIQDMQTRQQLVTNVGPQGRSPVKEGSTTHIMLGSKKERMAFFVDRRGTFADAGLWDKVFFRPY
ncbi:hypothetical protein BGZ52_006557 [Haplosporangium bisporale]|nr:hypothetical protein BGZ52_006557 [Haplosporangium bisporale]KAF9217065.1 hypothetical protein BGZ59_006649 [Podila verticillata]KFH70575.1 hypothetical protein MVEG_03425 [Podila verticillata NRRL 6337]